MSPSSIRWLLGLAAVGSACAVSPSSSPARPAPSVSATSVASSPTTPLLDRDLFFDEGGRGFVSISRDGETIAYVGPTGAGRRALFLAPSSSDLSKGREVIDAARVAGVEWTHDRRYLVVLADRDGDEQHHVHVLDLQDPTATLRDLTPITKPDFTASICELPRDDPGRIVVLLNDRDPELSDVYDVDIDTGRRTLVHRVPAGTSDVHCDERGRPRLLERRRDDGDTELLRIDGRRRKSLQSWSETETFFLVSFVDDDTVMGVTNRGASRDLSELVEIDLRSGRETTIHRDPEGDVDVSSVVVHPITQQPLAVVYVGDRERVYPLDPGFAGDWARAQAHEPGMDMSLVGISDDLERWVVAYGGPTRPATFYEFGRRTGSTRKLLSSRPRLDDAPLAPMRAIRYSARDGLEIRGYLTTPRGVEESDLPLVVLVHGGPWARDWWGYDPEVQFLANRGYAVLQVNFRGSEGFGKAFLRAANRTWGTGAAQHDLEDGVAELVRQGVVDPQRVCIYGASYGGYAALAGVAFTPDKYACAISYVGPSNLVTLVESFPASWRTGMGLWDEAFGNPANPTERADLLARSPLFAVDRIRASLMVVQGANDPRVKQAESDQIVAALKTRGVAARYLLAGDEGHGFHQPINRRALYAAMEQFLGAHLGGRVQKDVPAEVDERLRALETAGAATLQPSR